MNLLPRHSWTAALIVGCAALFGGSASGGTFIDNGQAQGRIIIPAGADAKIVTSALTLAGYLQQMSGATVTIQTDASPIPAGFHIRLGAVVDPGMLTEQQIGLDGFVIRSDASGVAIAGSNAHGTTNGMYHFAENILNIHWFSPEASGPTIPQQATVQIASMNQTVKPDMKWRGQYYSFQQRDDYQTLGPLAQQINANRDAWWAFNRMSSPPTFDVDSGEAFHRIVPPDLFASHPEYFPLVDYTFGPPGPHQDPYANRVPSGNPPQRIAGMSVQLELSNPEVQQRAIDWTRQQFAANPNLKIASLSVNDGPWWSTSPEFLAMGPDDSSRYVAFVNIVANANQALYPDRGYMFLAYDGSSVLRPPTGITVHPNATPIIAPVRLDRVHSILSDHPDSVYLRQVIEGWVAVSQKIAYRPYINDGSLTTPGALTLADEAKYLRDHGSMGGFREHQYLPGVGWAMLNWMEVQLMWDADQDPRQLRRQFVDGYYGSKSGAAVDQVYEIVETNLRNNIVAGDPNAQMTSTEYLKPLVQPALGAIGLALRNAQTQSLTLRQRVEHDMWTLAEIGATPIFEANFENNATPGTLLGKTTQTGQTWEAFTLFGNYGSLGIGSAFGRDGTRGAGTNSSTFAGNSAPLGVTLTEGLLQLSMDLQTQSPDYSNSTLPIKQWFLRDTVSGNFASVFWDSAGNIGFEGLGINSGNIPSGMNDHTSMHLTVSIDLDTHQVTISWLDNNSPEILSRRGNVTLGTYSAAFAPNVLDIWGRGESDGINSGYDNIRLIHLSVPPQPLLGDFDGDGDVDGADFVVWQTHFPTANGATLATGDADGDGDVDGADFVIWQTNFPLTTSSGVATVPEPSAAVLVLTIGPWAKVLSPRRARSRRFLRGMGAAGKRSLPVVKCEKT